MTDNLKLQQLLAELQRAADLRKQDQPARAHTIEQAAIAKLLTMKDKESEKCKP